MLNNALRLALALALSGCATASNPQKLCEAAQNHIADCLGTELPSDLLCDEEAARIALDTECSEIAPLAGERSDSFADPLYAALCRLGSLQLCEIPVCEERIESESACEDYLALDNCGACDFYECRDAEAESQCGGDGYYLGFGLKHCRLLTQVTAPLMSAQGQRWLSDTRRCLIEFIDKEIDSDASCQEIEDTALRSHIDCYVDAGFCDLPLSDLHKMAASISVQYLDFITVVGTGVSCFAELFDS